MMSGKGAGRGTHNGCTSKNCIDFGRDINIHVQSTGNDPGRIFHSHVSKSRLREGIDSSSISMDSRPNHDNRIRIIHNESYPICFIQTVRNFTVQTPWNYRSTDWRHCRRSFLQTLDNGYADGERRVPRSPGHHIRRCFWIGPLHLDTLQARLEVCDSCDPLDIRLGDFSGHHISRERAQPGTLHICACGHQYRNRAKADVVCSIR
jgi:hypothetical protein